MQFEPQQDRNEPSHPFVLFSALIKMQPICSGRGGFTAAFVIKSAGNVRTVGARATYGSEIVFNQIIRAEFVPLETAVCSAGKRFRRAIRTPKTKNLARKQSARRLKQPHIPDRDYIRSRN